MTELTPQTQPLQKLWVIEKRYRPTTQAVGHVTPLQFKDASLFPAGAVQQELGCFFLGRLFLCHFNPHGSSLSGVPSGWDTAE